MFRFTAIVCLVVVVVALWTGANAKPERKIKPKLVLHNASLHDPEIVIKSRVLLNATSKSKVLPLVLAPEKPKSKVNPLFLAPEKPKSKVNQLFLAVEKPKSKVNPLFLAVEKPKSKVNPLFLAVEKPKSKVNPLFLAVEKPKSKVNPLFLAVEKPKSKVNPLFLAVETPKSKVNPLVLTFEKPKSKVNPLVLAVEKPKSKVNPLFLAVETPKSKVNPLFLAVEKPKSKVNPLVLTFEKPKSKVNPLFLAVEKPKSKVNPLFLTFEKPKSKVNPLFFAVEKPKSKVNPLVLAVETTKSKVKPLVLASGFGEIRRDDSPRYEFNLKFVVEKKNSIYSAKVNKLIEGKYGLEILSDFQRACAKRGPTGDYCETIVGDLNKDIRSFIRRLNQASKLLDKFNTALELRSGELDYFQPLPYSVDEELQDLEIDWEDPKEEVDLPDQPPDNVDDLMKLDPYVPLRPPQREISHKLKTGSGGEQVKLEPYVPLTPQVLVTNIDVKPINDELKTDKIELQSSRFGNKKPTKKPKSMDLSAGFGFEDIPTYDFQMHFFIEKQRNNLYKAKVFQHFKGHHVQEIVRDYRLACLERSSNIKYCDSIVAELSNDIRTFLKRLSLAAKYMDNFRATELPVNDGKNPNYHFQLSLHVERRNDQYQAKVVKHTKGHHVREVLTDFRRSCYARSRNPAYCRAIVSELKNDIKTFIRRLSLAAKYLDNFNINPRR